MADSKDQESNAKNPKATAAPGGGQGLPGTVDPAVREASVDASGSADAPMPKQGDPGSANPLKDLRKPDEPAYAHLPPDTPVPKHGHVVIDEHAPVASPRAEQPGHAVPPEQTGNVAAARAAEHDEPLVAEPDNPQIGTITVVTAAILVSVTLIVAVLWNYFGGVFRDEMVLKQEQAESPELRELRAAEQAKLTRYQWVSQKDGVVRIPTARARELVLAEYGKPLPPGQALVTRDVEGASPAPSPSGSGPITQSSVTSTAPSSAPSAAANAPDAPTTASSLAPSSSIGTTGPSAVPPHPSSSAPHAVQTRGAPSAQPKRVAPKP